MVPVTGPALAAGTGKERRPGHAPPTTCRGAHYLQHRGHHPGQGNTPPDTKKGSNQIQFSWAGTLIDPTSVELRVLEHAEQIEVADTVFPGQKRQHLIWNIVSAVRGRGACRGELLHERAHMDRWTTSRVTDPGRRRSLDFTGPRARLQSLRRGVRERPGAPHRRQASTSSRKSPSWRDARASPFPSRANPPGSRTTPTWNSGGRPLCAPSARAAKSSFAAPPGQERQEAHRQGRA